MGIFWLVVLVVIGRVCCSVVRMAVVGVGARSVAVVEGAQSLWANVVGRSGAVGYGAQSVGVVAWSSAIDEVAQTLVGSGWVVV